MEVTFCRDNGRHGNRLARGLLGSVSNAGSLAVSRLLQGGRCSLEMRARGARGSLGRAACLGLRAASFPAAAMLAAILAQPGFLGAFPGQASVGPNQSLTRDRWRAAGRVCSPTCALSLFISVQVRAGQLLLLVVCLVLGGIWKLNSQQAGKGFHIFLWLRVHEGERRRRCDLKVKAAVLAHLARPLISYIICILSQDFGGKT